MNKRPTNKELESLVNRICPADDYNCKDSIMKEIQDGNLSMRSRWLVFVEEFGIRTVWILSVFLLIAIINLTLFILSRGGQWAFLDFGTSGMGIVFTSAPFGWIAFGTSLFVFMIVVMKRFSWSYHFPLKLFSFLLIGGVFAAGGVAFATGVNDSLYKKLVENPGESNSLLAKLYCLCANPIFHSNKALMGEVLAVKQDSLVVQTPTLDIVTVATTSETLWLDDGQAETFTIVKMLGEKDGDQFLATHIKVHRTEGMDLTRLSEDCDSKESWQHKQEVVEQRRQAVLQPLTPAVGTVQFVKSIY